MIHFSISDGQSSERHLTKGISYIVDTNRSSKDVVIAKDFLAGLNAESLALLRRTDYQLRRSGTPRFRCGFCGDPVHIRVTSVAESGVSDGRRASLVHDPRTLRRDCPFGTFAEGISPAKIDERRFRGRQEGARHRHLKHSLCNMLNADPNIRTAGCEVLVTGLASDGRPTWRRPDVLATTVDGRALAFDVQIAAPLLHTIAGRETFYGSNKIAWHWVVDPEQPYRLQLQGFQDVVLPQGGRVLGFSETAHRLTMTDLQSRLYLLDVIEAAGHQGFEVSRKVIKLETALRLGGSPKDGSPRFATDLRALALMAAIRDGDTNRAGRIFDLLAATCNAQNWNAAKDDGLTDALTALIVLLAVRDAERISAGVRQLFGDDPSSGLPTAALCNWADLIHRISNTDGHILERASAIVPDASARIGAVLSEPQRAMHSNHLWETWSVLLRRLFPRLAV